jgi:putative flippase GtrA
MRFFNREFIRFILVGGVNTLITFGIYALLLLVMPYLVAYTTTYVIGIFFSYLLNTRFVFKGSFGIKKALQYPLVYLVQYLVGLVALYILVDNFNINRLLASPLIILVTIPVTFLMSRWIINGPLTQT